MITEKSNRLQVIMITDYDYPNSVPMRFPFHTWLTTFYVFEINIYKTDLPFK